MNIYWWTFHQKRCRFIVEKLMDLSYRCRRRNQVRCHAAIKIVDSTSNIPYWSYYCFFLSPDAPVRFTRWSYQYGYNLKLQRVVDQPSFTYTWICILYPHIKWSHRLCSWFGSMALCFSVEHCHSCQSKYLFCSKNVGKIMQHPNLSLVKF